MIAISHLQCCDFFFNFWGKLEGDTSEADNQKAQLKVSHGGLSVQPRDTHPTLYSGNLSTRLISPVYKILGVRNVCHHLSTPSCLWQSPIHHMWSSAIIH